MTNGASLAVSLSHLGLSRSKLINCAQLLATLKKLQVALFVIPAKLVWFCWRAHECPSWRHIIETAVKLIALVALRSIEDDPFSAVSFKSVSTFGRGRLRESLSLGNDSSSSRGNNGSQSSRQSGLNLIGSGSVWCRINCG